MSFEFTTTNVNNEADHKYFNEYIKTTYPTEYSSIRYEGNRPFIMFNTEPSPAVKAAINLFYDGLTAADITLHDILALYDVREIDGINYVKLKRAELAAMFMQGDISLPDALFIENKTRDTRQWVKEGDWLTAQNEITNNVVVEYPYTQEIHDSIKAGIDDYIANNYNLS